MLRGGAVGAPAGRGCRSWGKPDCAGERFDLQNPSTGALSSLGRVKKRAGLQSALLPWWAPLLGKGSLCSVGTGPFVWPHVTLIGVGCRERRGALGDHVGAARTPAVHRRSLAWGASCQPATLPTLTTESRC